MLPIYTRYLAPADYGVIELLSMILDVTGLLLGMRIGEAIFRFYCGTDDEREKRLTVSTALILTFLMNTIGVIFVILAAPSLSKIVLGNISYAWLLSLFGITLVTTALEIVPLTYIRAQQRPWTYFHFSWVKLVLQIALNLYFVVYRGLGVEGVIYSALISGGTLAIALSTYTIRSVGLTYSRHQAVNLVKFTAPLILAALGSFYITFGDRYFLRVFSGLESVGIYSLGYKFGFILVVLTWMPFQQIWDSQRYVVGKSINAIELFSQTFSIISSVMIVGGLAIALFVEDLLRIMSAPEFWSAHRVVPYILVAYLYQCWTNFCRYGLLLKKQTVQITIGAWIAAVVVTAGYILLIPRYDVIGAAIATLIAFVSRFIWENNRAKKAFDMQLPWVRVNSLLLVAIIIYCLSLLLPNSLVVSIVARMLILIGFVCLVLFSPIMRSGDRKLIMRSLRKPLAIFEGSTGR